MRITASIPTTVIVTAGYLTAFANVAFFRNVAATFAGDLAGYAHVAALGAVLFCALVALLSLFAFRPLLKPVFGLLLLIAAVSAYFMDTYNVIIDSDMLVNVVSTDLAESRDLVTWRLAAYVGLIGVLPTALLGLVQLRGETPLTMLRNRAILLGGAVVVALAVMLSASSFFATFIREHKPLRYYSNPATPIYAAFKFTRKGMAVEAGPPRPLGTDAQRPVGDQDRELVVLVVGETARADRFSLNGYARDTNPRLANEDLVSFTSVTSCGTSTAVSVPCMFAVDSHDSYDDGRARATENLLDVLAHAGVRMLWRDNNTGSKGVANRVAYESFRTPDTNPVCDLECRDTGMLAGLQEFVDSQAAGDILIVLHQMGSHGPAYYKRYPERFRVFEPTCETSQLDECDQAAIGNTYDNTILYTDHFLAQVIAFLKHNDSRFETAMLYLSDHGESLGEAGLYLHGLPEMLAPSQQTHVPMMLWVGSAYDDIDLAAVQRLRDLPLSHDNLFHTVLGLFELHTAVYRPDLDILQMARELAGTEREFD